MATAPDGRVLSPGEVYEEAAPPQEDDEWKADLNVYMICPECNEKPPNLIEEYSSGDTVCASCGLVLSNRMVDTRSEWRTFANDEGGDDPSRVGDAANPLLNGSQLETTMAWDGKSGNRELHRAQNKTSNDKSTRQLLQVYKTIGAYCDAAHLPHTVTESAKQLYKIVDDHKAFKGKSQEALIAGAIFIACRSNNAARSFREVYALTRVSKKEIGRTFKAMSEFFKTVSNDSIVPGGSMGYQQKGIVSSQPRTDPEELCRRYCAILNLGKGSLRLSQQLCDQISSVGALAGRSPLSAAAACIYMTSHLMGEGKTPKEVADAAGVSDGTVRTAYRLLFQEKDKLIKPEWLERGADPKRLPAA